MIRWSKYFGEDKKRLYTSPSEIFCRRLLIVSSFSASRNLTLISSHHLHIFHQNEYWLVDQSSSSPGAALLWTISWDDNLPTWQRHRPPSTIQLLIILAIIFVFFIITVNMIPMVDDHWNRCYLDLNGRHLDKLVLKAIDHLLLLFDYLRLQGHLWQYELLIMMTIVLMLSTMLSLVVKKMFDHKADLL